MHNVFQKKCVCLFLSIFFFLRIIVPGNSYAQSALPTSVSLPETELLLNTTHAYSPIIVKGLTIHPEKPFEFDFIVDPGDSHLPDNDFKKESQKLIKYFLASLTVSENDMWVNLSPYEKDRMIPDPFGQTEMGKDLLAQDYLLKQLTASLMYPENELGQNFWEKIYKQAYEKYGTTDIAVDTFNKVWIVPEKAVVYVHANSAFVVESKLKVMLEEDYLASQENSQFKSKKAKHNQNSNTNASDVSHLTSNVIKDIIIPVIEKEVNEGKHFTNLRQIYHSIILASWMKKKLLSGQYKKLPIKGYVDANKVHGIDHKENGINKQIYSKYIDLFKKGVYAYIKEEYDPSTRSIVPKKYFSGGYSQFQFSSKTLKETNNPDAAMSILDEKNLKDVHFRVDLHQEETKKPAISQKDAVINNGEDAPFKIVYNQEEGTAATKLSTTYEKLTDERTWKKYFQAFDIKPKPINPQTLHQHLKNTVSHNMLKISAYTWQEGFFDYTLKILHFGQNANVSWLKDQKGVTAYLEVRYQGPISKDMFLSRDKKQEMTSLFNKINRKYYKKWKLKKFDNLLSALEALNTSLTPFLLLQEDLRTSPPDSRKAIEQHLKNIQNNYHKNFIDFDEETLKEISFTDDGIALKKFILQKLGFLKDEKGRGRGPTPEKNLLAIHSLTKNSEGKNVWNYYVNFVNKLKNVPILISDKTHDFFMNQTESKNIAEISRFNDSHLPVIKAQNWISVILSLVNYSENPLESSLVFYSGYSYLNKVFDSEFLANWLRILGAFYHKTFDFHKWAFPLIPEVLTRYKNIDGIKTLLAQEPFDIDEDIQTMLGPEHPAYSELAVQALIQLLTGKDVFNFNKAAQLKNAIKPKIENLETFKETNLLDASDHIRTILQEQKREELYYPDNLCAFYRILGIEKIKLDHLKEALEIREALREKAPDLKELRITIGSPSKESTHLIRRLMTKDNAFQYSDIQIKYFISFLIDKKYFGGNKKNTGFTTFPSPSQIDLKSSRLWHQFVSSFQTRPKDVTESQVISYLNRSANNGSMEVGAFTWGEGAYQFILRTVKAGINKKNKVLKDTPKVTAYLEVRYRGGFSRKDLNGSKNAQNVFNWLLRKYDPNLKKKDWMKFSNIYDAFEALNTTIVPFKIFQKQFEEKPLRVLDSQEQSLLEKVHAHFKKEFTELNNEELQNLNYMPFGITLKKKIVLGLKIPTIKANWENNNENDLLAMHVLRFDKNRKLIWEYFFNRNKKMNAMPVIIPERIKDWWEKQTPSGRIDSKRLFSQYGKVPFRAKVSIWIGFLLLNLDYNNHTLEKFLFYLQGYQILKQTQQGSISLQWNRLLQQFTSMKLLNLDLQIFDLASELYPHFQNDEQFRIFLKKPFLHIYNQTLIMIPAFEKRFTAIALAQLTFRTVKKIHYSAKNSIDIYKALLPSYKTFENFETLFNKNLLDATDIVFEQLDSLHKEHLATPLNIRNFLYDLGKKDKNIKFLNSSLIIRYQLRDEYPHLNLLRDALLKIPEKKDQIAFIKAKLQNPIGETPIRFFIKALEIPKTEVPIQEINEFAFKSLPESTSISELITEEETIAFIASAFLGGKKFTQDQAHKLFGIIADLLFDADAAKELMLKAGIDLKKFDGMKRHAQILTNLLKEKINLHNATEMIRKEIELENSQIMISYKEFQEEIFKIIEDKDDAMISQTKGGIDLNAQNLFLEIKGEDNIHIPIPENLIKLDWSHIDGLVPLIINITPVINLPMLLGMHSQKTETGELPSHQSLK